MSSCRASLVLAVALSALLPHPARAEPPAVKASAPAEARHTDRYGDLLPEGALARLGSLRWRAGAQVDWLTWSPDGKVLGAVADGDVCLFDVATGKLTKRIRAMSWPAERAVFAPDGKRLLIWSTLYIGQGFRKKALHVWDLLAGRPVLEDCPKDETTSGGVQWVGWSAEGRPLAVYYADMGIRLRDLSDGRETRFDVDAGDVESLIGGEPWAYAAGAKLLAMPGEHGIIHVWDAATGAARRNFKAQEAYVSGLALSPDGRLLASLSRAATWTDGGVVELWDVAAGKVKYTFASVEGRGGALGFTPDGKTLVAALPSQEAHFWDVSTGRERGRTPARRTGLTTSLAFSPDGKTLATAEGWGAIHFWDASTGAPQPERAGPSGWARPAAFSPDGRQLATGSTDGTVYLWDARTEDLLAQVRRPGRWLRTWAFSADGRSLYSSWDDNQVYLSDAATGRPLHVLAVEDPGRPVPRQQDVNLALSGNGSTLVTLSARGPWVPNERDNRELLVTGWDPATRKCLFQRRRPLPDYQATVVTADGRILAAQNSRLVEEDERLGTGPIRLEDMATGREVLSLPPVPDAWTFPLAFSPDGRLFAASSYGPAPDEKDSRDDVQLLRLWEVVSATEVLALRVEVDADLDGDSSWQWMAPLIAFRPDGRLLALPASKREVLLWDLRRGGEWRRIRGLTADLTGLAFSPDGRRLVTGLSDSTSLVWDVAGTRQAGMPDLPGPDGVARAWAELAAGAPRAFAARGRLADSPGQAVPLLKQHLRPVKPADADQMRRLIADLDSNTFAVREDASKRLEELGESAEGTLRRALADRPSPEACRRIGRLLEALRGPVTRPEALRSLRALAVLEDIGTPEARQVLGRVAQGAPEARLTQEAKASLGRLAGQRARLP